MTGPQTLLPPAAPSGVRSNKTADGQYFFSAGDYAPLTFANHFFREKERRWSGKTQRQYVHYLGDWLRFCNEAGVDPVQAQRSDLVAYFDHMLVRTCSNTVNQHVRLLEQFFVFLVANRYRTSVPFGVKEVRYSTGMLRATVTKTATESDLRLRPESRQERRYCLRSELIEFIKSLSNPRDALAARIMYSVGLRVSEVAALTMDDFPSDLAGYIDRKETALLEIIGKRGKIRTVRFAPGLLAEVKEYFDGMRGRATTRLLLVTSKGEAVKAQAIAKRIKNHALDTGLVSITSHMFRHGYAMERLIFLTKLYGKDYNPSDDRSEFTPAYRALKQVASELGHSHVSTTEQYLIYLDTYAGTYNQDHIDWFSLVLPEGGSK